jgi:pantetheine-phosphate adenylyltransferase
MLIDLFDRVGADWIIKGVRSVTDFEYEQKHALYNRAHNPRAETLYLPADPAFDGLSSTLVRERIAHGEDLTGLLPEAVIRRIAEHSRP